MVRASSPSEGPRNLLCVRSDRGHGGSTMRGNSYLLREIGRCAIESRSSAHPAPPTRVLQRCYCRSERADLTQPPLFFPFRTRQVLVEFSRIESVHKWPFAAERLIGSAMPRLRRFWYARRDARIGQRQHVETTARTHSHRHHKASARSLQPQNHS